MAEHTELTRNEALVLSALRREERPRSAYQLLDDLREKGLRAPPQIYRALKTLGERGLVHKIESLNAFLPCTHAHCHASHAHAVVFLVCETCERVEEVEGNGLDDALIALARRHAMTPTRAVVEMRGRCRDCGATVAA